jgi:Uma2 family endonuclease
MATVVEEYATLEKAQPAAPSPKLTLEQANKLAAGHPFELIDGEVVFKDDLKRVISSDSPLTLEQANRLSEGRTFELINGRMVFKMPDYKHARAQAKLCKKLDNYFDANPIGEVLTELSHRLWPENPREWRQPDLSIILNEHLQESEQYPTRAPDIAIEIISDDEAWTKLFEKAKLYFQKGSREVWLVDPYEKGVTIVTPASKRWVLDTLTSELLPGFQVELKDIFTWPVAPDVTK